MGKIDTREQQLLQHLMKVKSMKTSEIQEMFGVSPATARRMCADLEQKGKAVRCFGGIQYLLGNYFENESMYSFDTFSSKNLNEKISIGNEAAKYIEDGEIIYISGGTTTFQFCRSLAERFRQGGLHELTVMTNSFDNAEVLSKYARVIVTGGNYRSRRRDMAGMICEKAVAKSHFDKCFVGVDGIDVSDGLMAFDIDTARIDQLVISHSATAYILTDSSKFICNSFISYGNISSEHIITDSLLNPEIAEKARSFGINLTTV